MRHLVPTINISTSHRKSRKKWMRLHLFFVKVWCPHAVYQDMFTTSPGPRDTIGIKSDPKNFKGYREDGHPQVRIEVPFVKNTLTGNKKHMNAFSVNFLTHTYESRATSRIAKSRRNLKLKKNVVVAKWHKDMPLQLFHSDLQSSNQKHQEKSQP